MINVSVMVSGGGTNLQAIMDGIADGRIADGRVALVLSSRDGVYALSRAQSAGVKTVVISKEEYKDADKKADAILAALSKAETGLVITAGYMSVIHEKVCAAYAGRIINIHPALLPKFGGLGYYGLRVHRAVLEAGEAETGATVHYVDTEGIDTGEIIMQRTVPVFADDTPETLQKRVLEEVEHDLIVEATALVVRELAAAGPGDEAAKRIARSDSDEAFERGGENGNPVE